MHCHHFSQFQQTFLDYVRKIVNDSSILTDDALVNFSLYGSQTYNFEENGKIIKASAKYIKYRKVFRSINVTFLFSIAVSFIFELFIC